MMISPTKYPGTGAKATPIQKAEQVLMDLYKLKEKQSGCAPTLATFYPVDPTEIITLLGWTLHQVSMVGDSGSPQRHDALLDFEKKTITAEITGEMLRSDLSGRARFTLAHEIGHILLHDGKGARIRARVAAMREKNGKQGARLDPQEREANRFATEFLMPRRAVEMRFKEIVGYSQIFLNSRFAQALAKEREPQALQSGESLTRESLAKILARYTPSDGKGSLATFFGVSVETMGYRLLELRLALGRC